MIHNNGCDYHYICRVIPQSLIYTIPIMYTATSRHIAIVCPEGLPMLMGQLDAHTPTDFATFDGKGTPGRTNTITDDSTFNRRMNWPTSWAKCPVFMTWQFPPFPALFWFDSKETNQYVITGSCLFLNFSVGMLTFCQVHFGFSFLSWKCWCPSWLTVTTDRH